MIKAWFISTLTVLVLDVYAQDWIAVDEGLDYQVYDMCIWNDWLCAAVNEGWSEDVMCFNDSFWFSLGSIWAGSDELICIENHDGIIYGGTSDPDGAAWTYRRTNGNWNIIGGHFLDLSEDWASIRKLLSVDGKLYAAGFFSEVDDIPMSNIAVLEDDIWTALEDGVPNAVLEMYAWGDEVLVNHHGPDELGVDRGQLSVWNGESWLHLDDSFNQMDVHLLGIENGLIYFTQYDPSDNEIPPSTYSWDGETSVLLDQGHILGSYSRIIIYGESLYYVGKYRHEMDEGSQDLVMKLEDGEWIQVGQAFDGYLRDAETQDGKLYVGGQFGENSPQDLHYIAVLDTLVGIRESTTNHTTLFPNPATDNFHLQFQYSGKRMVEVRSLTGKTLLRSELHSPGISIQTENWEAGLYLVQVLDTTTNHCTIFKLVIGR